MSRDNMTDTASLSPSLTDDALWQMNLRSSETIESGSYPERPGELDCSYYIRTGLCRFGATCRFNHPPNRTLAIAAVRMNGEFPERLGQPECQYYLKTGTCKFGTTCKFHHPRDKAGIAGRVSLNILGYPLRPNDIECAYYLRTGQCKFGTTCKFHHPQPANMMVSMSASPVYSSVSPTATAQPSYLSGVNNWSRASYLTSPRWQGTSSYAPLLVPQGMVSVPGWNAYSGQLGSVTSSESHQQTAGNSQTYGTSRQSGQTNSGSQGAYSPYRAGSLSVGFYAMQDSVFPERPGQPECQFYMKTGDCKFGAVCRFHHPRHRLIPAPDCVLSHLGLPLRPVSYNIIIAQFCRLIWFAIAKYSCSLFSTASQVFYPVMHKLQKAHTYIKRRVLFMFKGEPLCIFYSRYGICKFGPSCKFDHPMGIFAYNLSTPSSTDVPVRRVLEASSGTNGLNFPSEGTGSKPRHLSQSDSGRVPSGVDHIDTE